MVVAVVVVVEAGASAVPTSCCRTPISHALVATITGAWDQGFPQEHYPLVFSLFLGMFASDKLVIDVEAHAAARCRMAKINNSHNDNTTAVHRYVWWHYYVVTARARLKFTSGVPKDTADSTRRKP